LESLAGTARSTKRLGHDIVTIDREIPMLRLLLAAGILCGLMATGCSTKYYRVTDPGSGKTYYTNKFERVWQGGAVNFEDGQYGISVTLQSSEIKELSEGEFMAGLAVNQASSPSGEATSNENFSRVLR